MKNCADSAAQAISIAAMRMHGAVHSTDQGPSSEIGSAASISRAKTGTPTCCLLEGDFMASRDARMLLELRFRLRKVYSEVRPAALLALQRTPGDQFRYGMDVA